MRAMFESESDLRRRRKRGTVSDGDAKIANPETPGRIRHLNEIEKGNQRL